MKKKIKVAITGGIGSGKSSVSKLIEQFGFPVLRSDDLAKDLMQNDDSIKKKIIKAFGKNSYSENRLNKEYLAQNVFCKKRQLEKINSIVHPAVIQKVRAISSELFLNHPLVFVESALVFEAKIQKEFDYIILVYAEEETRIKRLVLKSTISKADILKRIKFQIPDEKKIDKVHFVIDNNSSFEELEHRTKFILDLLKSLLT
jgi:dephospho-CoA kinase